mgnify:CR=1 FL=1
MEPNKPKKQIRMPENKANLKTVTTPNKAASGAGMDRAHGGNAKFKRYAWMITTTILAAGAMVFLSNPPEGQSMTIKSDRLQLADVTSGTFEDFIPVRGRVTPAKTLYLDAVEGGRVERILVEDGTQLNAGDMIVELSNATLQLSVLGNEARVAEQLNNMRSIELSLQQNRLAHKRNLVDINYQINMLSRQLEREEALSATNSISQSQYMDTLDTLNWYKNRRDITLESQASDAKMQEAQLLFLKETSARLEGNLAISRQNMENMNVKAPVAGTLSGFNIEIGQSIGRGERLGQIDTPNDYKLSVLIDEYYLSRVDLGQTASFDLSGQTYQLKINKIYPQVKNSQFEVDLVFTSEQPTDIRRGQTVQTKLILGDASSALLIPNGSFYQDTGGNWIFVVSQDGESAVKRQVKLGRRNSRYIEVLEGLQAGERVLISPYNSFVDMERLRLN